MVDQHQMEMDLVGNKEQVEWKLEQFELELFEDRSLELVEQDTVEQGIVVRIVVVEKFVALVALVLIC